MALGPWIEYQIWSRPVPGWQGKTVDLHCEYFGPDKMERLGMDLFPMDPFPKCLLISAMAVWGGSAHRLGVMLRLDRMVWPVSLLAAFFSWKIGRAIVARRTARNESSTQPLGEWHCRSWRVELGAGCDRRGAGILVYFRLAAGDLVAIAALGY
jgi:hypothetical protein